jgi:hypothetical protein
MIYLLNFNITYIIILATCFDSYESSSGINLLEPELLFFLILAHPVHKMWIIHEPNMLELWNKLHFEEEKTDSIHHV